MTIEERLCEVEKQFQSLKCRRNAWRSVAVACLVAIAVGTVEITVKAKAQAVKEPNIIKANGLTLEDENGRAYIEISSRNGVSMFRMYDSDQRVKVGIMAESDAAAMSIEGKTVSHIFSTSKDGATIGLTDNKSRNFLFSAVARTNAASVCLDDQRGKHRASMEFNDDVAAIRLTDQGGRTWVAKPPKSD